MAGRRDVAISVDTRGAREVEAAFEDLGADAQAELDKLAEKLAAKLAGFIRAAGQAEGSQAALVAGSVKAKSGRPPSVLVGGSSPRGRGGGSASDLIFGSEFGHSGQGGRGKETRDYAPHGFGPRNKEGAWIFPTIDRELPKIGEEYEDLANDLLADFVGFE